MGVRHWVGALSVAAVLGVLVGAVYSGVTGWTGRGDRAAAEAGVGLPAPGEQPGRADATAPAAVRSGMVRSAQPAAEPGRQPARAPKVKKAKVKPATAGKPAKDEAGTPDRKERGKPARPGKRR